MEPVLRPSKIGIPHVGSLEVYLVDLGLDMSDPHTMFEQHPDQLQESIWEQITADRQTHQESISS